MASNVTANRKSKALPHRGRTSTSSISNKNQVTVPVDILRHPFAELIAAAGSIYDHFDLKKERSLMWTAKRTQIPKSSLK